MLNAFFIFKQDITISTENNAGCDSNLDSKDHVIRSEKVEIDPVGSLGKRFLALLKHWKGSFNHDHLLFQNWLNFITQLTINPSLY